MTNKIKTLFCIFFICLNHLHLQAQSPNNFSKEWKDITQLEEKGLTRSALEKTEMLFQKAVKDANNPQIIKAANYLMKYRNMVDDRSHTGNVYFLDSLITITQSPAKNILQNMKAELLANYIQNYLY